MVDEKKRRATFPFLYPLKNGGARVQQNSPLSKSNGGKNGKLERIKVSKREFLME